MKCSKILKKIKYYINFGLLRKMLPIGDFQSAQLFLPSLKSLLLFSKKKLGLKDNINFFDKKFVFF